MVRSKPHTFLKFKTEENRFAYVKTAIVVNCNGKRNDTTLIT